VLEAIRDGAGEIATPALVSTLCICIVFVPIFLLSGVAKYLFAPLAEAVIFAMIASYILCCRASTGVGRKSAGFSTKCDTQADWFLSR
jgi:Cu/Ag efflux pump CusA